MHGVGAEYDRVTADERGGTSLLEAAVGQLPEQTVVLATAVETDRRPHRVVVSDQVDRGRPHDVEHGEFIAVEPRGEHRLVTRVPEDGLDGRRLGDDSGEHLVDSRSRMARCVSNGCEAVADQLIDAEGHPDHRSPTPPATEQDHTRAITTA